MKTDKATREPNVWRREREKAAAFLRERGACYLRGMMQRRAGWWSAEGLFLGARSLEARKKMEEALGLEGVRS